MVTRVAQLIDTLHLGYDRVIGAYEVDGLIVDPGPTVSLGSLDGIEPRGLLLTHIHLDHAGGTGVLVRRFPGLKVYVHERGAPHLVDPSRLLRSAGMLYGNDMDTLWGEVAPVPEENIVRLAGGEVVEGFRVEYTPGHASHHVCYLHESTGDAFVGDVAGARVPPGDHTIAPTPPPDIDVEAWLRSIDLVESWSPARLALTHFGFVDDVPEGLDRVREALRRQLEWAEAGPEEFASSYAEHNRATLDEDEAVRLGQAAPPAQLYPGLERYLRKRAEREAAEGAAA
jgi:glyoxylase-like metal-dependent hydrolase (beta-lactamase superfamily II)